MQKDIVIIGAGIIGLATAERLLVQGAKVTVLERNNTGQEASWAGGGILSPLFPWNYADEVTRLSSYSALQFPAWTSFLHNTTGIDPEYEMSGMLILPPFAEEAAQGWCAKRGIRIEKRTVCGIHSFSKNTGTDTLEPQDNALFLPEVAQIRNPKLLRALRSRVMQLGGRIIENCVANRLKTAHQQIQAIDSSCGEYTADCYIVCAGAWSKEMLGIHALGLNIRPIKGQMLLFKFEAPPIRSIIVHNDVYLIPRRDGHLLIGSTLEDTGFDRKTTTAARDYLLQRAQAILPELQGMPVKQHWSGLRPASPENIPTIGRHPVIRNLLINSGHFRYGVTMAPASAEILVNELTGGLQPFDITPYHTGWGAAG